MSREAQQKGEKMPTFEGQQHNVNPQTDRCVRCGRDAFNRKNQPICMTTGDYVEKWNKEQSERTPAASEERKLREAHDYPLRWPLARCIAANLEDLNIVDSGGDGIKAEEVIAQWLQSVPSSLPAPWPNKTGGAVLSPQIIREAVERVRQQIAAEPSDAGQPRCMICLALLPCETHPPHGAAQPRTCQEEQD